MGERPLSWLAAALAVLAFVLVQADTLLHVLRADQRLSERVAVDTLGSVERALEASRSGFEQGGVSDWPAALRVARQVSGAAEVELLTEDGTLLASYPAAAPVEHEPTPELLVRAAFSVVAAGPVDQGARLLHYAMVGPPGRRLLLRFATDVSELAESRRERRQLLVVHGVALLALLGAAALALSARASRPLPAGGALDAYEEAVARLQSRGRSAQAELARLGDELRDKSALARVGELTGGIAHEVRNGLGTILSHARLLERGGGSSEVEEAARAIREECDTLENVIRRFVDFVREEKLEPRELDLARMLGRVAARESRAHPAVETSVEAAGLTRPLVGDEDLLERAFENLVRNALEAAAPGGHVRIEAREVPGGVEVCVDDDGPGLPAGGEVLRPFATMKPGGTGLGLPIALKIVQLHGGELRLDDRPGGGARVRVRLPGTDPGVTGGNGPRPSG